MFGKQNTLVIVAKGLVLYLDQSLTYNDYVAKTASNCLHKPIQINRIKHLLDKKTLLLFMDSFIFSKSFYCLTGLSKTSKSNIEKLQLLQNFAARIVLWLRRKYDHISPGIKSLNWLWVSNRLNTNDVVTSFKRIHNPVPDYLIDKFIFRSQIITTNTRQSKNLNIPRCRLVLCIYRGAKIWASLHLSRKDLGLAKDTMEEIMAQ